MTGVQTCALPISGTIINSANFFIGQFNSTDYFNGLIDEVVIYDCELTQTQITYRYNSGAGREEMSTSAYAGYIYDKGDTTYFSSIHPIEIGNHSIIVDTTGKVYLKTLQITSGAGANKVLTSDISGNATWQTADDSSWIKAYADTSVSQIFLGYDATEADTFNISDDGDTTRFVSENPIKIGDGSLVVATDGKVSIKDMRMPTGASINKVLTSDAIGDVSWETPTADSTFSSITVDTVFVGTDSTQIYNNPGEIGGNDSYAELLIPSNYANNSTTFRDTSDNYFVITRNGSPVHTTDTYAIASSSMKFRSATSDYLTVPNNTKLNIDGSNYFVVDFWYKYNSGPNADQTIFEKKDGNNTYWKVLIHVQGTTYIEYMQKDFGITEVEMLYETAIVIDGNWHHYAIVKNSTTYYWYIDGTKVFSGSDPDTSPVNNGTLYIANDTGGNYLDGNLDEIRITKGSDRGWTGATINVPTTEYTEHVILPSVGVASSFTTNNEYASVYISSATNFAVAANVYKTIKPLAVDYLSSGIELTDSTLTVSQGGIYLLNFIYSGTSNVAAVDAYMTPFVNDTEITQIKLMERWPNATVGYSLSLSGLLQLFDGDVVKIKTKLSAGATFYINYTNVTLIKIN